jgi:hypothetical protein
MPPHLWIPDPGVKKAQDPGSGTMINIHMLVFDWSKKLKKNFHSQTPKVYAILE